MAHPASASLDNRPNVIEITNQGVLVTSLYIPRHDVVDYLRPMPEQEHGTALVHALEVGVFCLERARMAQDTEFVRRQVDCLLRQVEQVTNAIPGTIQQELLGKIGTADGQVLSPIKMLVDEVRRTLLERLHEVRVLLSEEMDPSKDTSKLGMVLRTLSALLDPKRRDSVQGVLADSIARAVGEDGIVAKTVKTAVQDTVRPLADEVNRLARQIQTDQAVKDALDQTTAKGRTYEDEVVQVLQEWASTAGIEIHHVGGDNQPGDIVLVSQGTSLAGLDLHIAIETRDRGDMFGRRRISEDIAQAIVYRKAAAGIYVSKTRGGLAAEIGDWAEGTCNAGPWVATIHEQLVVAVRYLFLRQRLAIERRSLPALNVEALEEQLQRIRTAMDRMTEINRKAAVARNAVDGIRSDCEAIRTDVRDALTRVEEAVKSASRTRETGS